MTNFNFNDTIICRNCQKQSYNNYYGFCSISCAADFAVKRNIIFYNVLYDFEEELKDEWEEKVRKADSEINYLEEENKELSEELDDLRKYKKEQINNHYIIEKKDEKINDLTKKIEEIKKELKDKIIVLEEENKKLKNKYSIFEIMDMINE